jgi:hypothetical protein
MKTTSHLKFIQWRDPAGLHEDTVKSILDIKFLKDELQFLKDLAAEHTLELIYGTSTEESHAIIKQLAEHSKRLEKLFKSLEEHRNNLQILMDEDDVAGELNTYKNQHYTLMIAEMDFHADLKKTKHIIFKLLSDIMKKSKQKKLS